MSPYIFILCLEILGYSIKQAVADKRWMPYQVSRKGVEPSHLFFADDLLLFGQVSYNQAQIMKHVFSDFTNMSGQIINIKKSRIFVSKNATNLKARRFSNELRIPLTSDLGKYLGIHIIHGRRPRHLYSELLDKIGKKMASWRSNCLSKASRKILIKIVAYVMPNYTMQITQLSIHVVYTIEKIQQNFLWGENRLHTKPWEQLCKPAMSGGLGFRKMRTMNLALLAKLAWQMLTEPHRLWVRVLSYKYGDLLEASIARHQASATWRGILQGRKVLLLGLIWNQDNMEWEWADTSSGCFSVQSAYQMMEYEDGGTPDNSWRKIWRLRGPQRLNLQLWEVKKEALKTNYMIAYRQGICTADYALCGAATENTIHAVHDCTWISLLWRQLVPVQSWYEFFGEQRTDKWIDFNISTNSSIGHI